MSISTATRTSKESAESCLTWMSAGMLLAFATGLSLATWLAIIAVI